METDLLAQLIDRKYELLSQLHQLARRQLALVGDGGDMSQLLSVLAAKQPLLDDLNSLDRQLDPFRQQDPDARIWHTPNDRQRCAQVAGRCQSLIGDILELERQGESELRRRRDRTAQQLEAVSSAAEAQTAYNAPAPLLETRLDLTSEA